MIVFFTVEAQRKTKPNLQSMKSFMSIDSEKSAASVKGSAYDRSESIASQDGNKVILIFTDCWKANYDYNFIYF